MPRVLVNDVKLYVEEHGSGAPTLVVSATDTAEAFRQVAASLAEVIPGARSARVAGGHMVDPTDPAVLSFVSELLEPGRHP